MVSKERYQPLNSAKTLAFQEQGQYLENKNLGVRKRVLEVLKSSYNFICEMCEDMPKYFKIIKDKSHIKSLKSFSKAEEKIKSLTKQNKTKWNLSKKKEVTESRSINKLRCK